MQFQAPFRAILAGLGVAALVACAPQKGGDISALDTAGAARVKIELVPSDVGCVVIQVVGATTVTQQFDVSPQANTGFALDGLPSGSDTFSSSAYAQACSQIAGAAATFVSNSVVATVSRDMTVSVALRMGSEASEASVHVEFPDSVSTGTAATDLAPAGVACIVVQVSGTSPLTFPFDVAPDSSTVFDLLGLPLGAATFSAQGFGTPCAEMSGAAPIATWASAGVAATVVTGSPAIVPLTMVENPAEELVSIAVTPPSPSIAVATTQQFTATGTYADASTLNLTSRVTWSSNSADATITSPGGLATGVTAGGPITITAGLTEDGQPFTATAQLTVTAASSPGPGCNSAPLPTGGGAQPYDNQTYCGTLTGTTDVQTTFTGTFTFTTPLTPGSIVGCQYATTLSAAGAPSTACAGTTDADGNVTLVDAVNDDSTLTRFTGVFSGDGKTLSGTFSSSGFGPSGFMVSGTFSGAEQ